MPPASNLSYVGRLRFIQTLHEPPHRRNPDHLVRHFVPLLDRFRCRMLADAQLGHLRSQPFYYYLLARTWYYDEVYVDAIGAGVSHIVNVGCGADTRAQRFRDALDRRDVIVLECDTPEAIAARQRVTRRFGPCGRVHYVSLDLNAEAWPELERWLNAMNDARVMLMMEGVSPYVEAEAFTRFLRLLHDRLPSGSLVAYDFKLSGVADEFGSGSATGRTFRLPGSRARAEEFHRELGFRLTRMEVSSELEERLLPDLASSGAPLFRQDCLVQLRVEPV